MASFEAAERALDPPALVAHFSTAGDFHMHDDGNRVSAAAIAQAVKQAFPTLQSLEGSKPLGAELHSPTGEPW